MLPTLSEVRPPCRTHGRGAHLHTSGGAMRTCTLDGCENPHRAKGLCHMHYRRLRTTGTLDRYGVPVDPYADTALKTCRRCGEAKARTEYTRNAMAADGLKGRCKACENEILREKYATNYKGMQERTLIRSRRWKYKVEPHELEALYDMQGGLCAICSKPLEGRFDVDHCHSTNEVRGLLHRKCNLVAGFFENTEDPTAKVLNYLQDPPMRRLARKKA